MQTDDANPIPVENEAKQAGARQLNFVLSALGVAAGLGFGLGGPALRWPSAIALALLPPVLMYLAEREPLLYALAKPRQDPRTDLGFAFMACAFGLVMGNRGIHFAGTEMLLECAGLIGLLCCLSTFRSMRGAPQFWSAMFGVFLIACVYGWGLAATADSLPDQSAPSHREAIVVNKYESYHRGTHYHLVFPLWAPNRSVQDLNVSYEAYANTSVGGRVCLALHQGSLYLPWYQLVECGGNSQQ